MVLVSRGRARGIAAAALAVPLLLAGCQANRAETAWQLMQQQDREQALARQEEQARAPQGQARPKVALSLIRQAQSEGRYFASLAYVDAYRQAYGDTPEVQVLRANALRRTGQVQASADAYRALLGGPQAAYAFHGLGLLAGGQGDFEQAADYLGQAARLRPTDAQMLNDLGYALLRGGSIQAARVPLGQAAELEPGNARILANLALLLLAEGDARGAGEVMDRADLGAEARQQVQQLAQQVRMAARPGGPGRTAGAVQVGDVQARTVMPSLPGQAPVMDRFGNPPMRQNQDTKE